jgi:hypothetical protein
MIWCRFILAAGTGTGTAPTPFKKLSLAKFDNIAAMLESNNNYSEQEQFQFPL